MRVSIVCMHRRRTPHEPDLLVLRAGGRQRVGRDKVYIEYLHVTKLRVTLSFLPSPGMCWRPVSPESLQPCCTVSEGIHMLVINSKTLLVWCHAVAPYWCHIALTCLARHLTAVMEHPPKMSCGLVGSHESPTSLLCKQRIAPVVNNPITTESLMLHSRGVQRVSVVHQCSRGGGGGLPGAGPPGAAPPSAQPPSSGGAGALPLHAGRPARPHCHAGLLKCAR